MNMFVVVRFVGGLSGGIVKRAALNLDKSSVSMRSIVVTGSGMWHKCTLASIREVVRR